MQPTATNQIELRNNRSGQLRSYVAGTRVRVLDLYAMAELQRQTADQIMDALPHLNLSQVHAALAYYFANRDEIVREFREEEALAERHRAAAGAGPLELNLQGRKARRDPLSS